MEKKRRGEFIIFALVKHPKVNGYASAAVATPAFTAASEWGNNHTRKVNRKKLKEGDGG